MLIIFQVIIEDKGKIFMKNWIIVFLIFAVPVGVFAWLESSSNKTVAKEAVSASSPVETVAETSGSSETVAKHEAPVSPVKSNTSGKPRMLKFSSPMCSDCKKVTTELVGVIPDYKDAVTFEEINVTDGSKESAALVKDYKVTVVPTLIFMSKDGKIVHKEEGLLTESEIRTHLDTIK